MAVTTPNMSLTIPSVGDTTPGYATSIANSLTAVDAHDHSAGKGVAIRAANLTWGGVVDAAVAQLQNLATVRLTDQPSAASLPAASYPRALFTVNGDLWYNTGGGVAMQLTSGGVLNGALIGGIVGQYASSGAAVSYNSTTRAYSFLDQSAAAATLVALGATFTGAVTVGSLTSSGNVTAGAGYVAIPSQTKTFRVHPSRGFWPNAQAQPAFGTNYYRPNFPAGTGTSWALPLPLPNYGTLTNVRIVMWGSGAGTAGNMAANICTIPTTANTGSVYNVPTFPAALNGTTTLTTTINLACAGNQAIIYFSSAASSTNQYVLLSVEFDVTMSQLPDVYG